MFLIINNYFFFLILFICEKRYGFAIGNVAAFDMSNPQAIVSPGIHYNNININNTTNLIILKRKVEWDLILIVE